MSDVRTTMAGPASKSTTHVTIVTFVTDQRFDENAIVTPVTIVTSTEPPPSHGRT
jgi:hypothetical protein